MKKLCTTFFFTICMLTVMFTGTAFAVPTCSGWNYYDANSGECVACGTNEFTITTTSLPANTEFWFTMSPKGSFAVDWGDGTINNIDRDNTTVTDYPHTYTAGGVKTIKICGKATEYNTAVADNVVAAISFYKNDSTYSSKWIASISGALGSVFPTISNTPAGQPRFRSTFQLATNLTTIPANLFNGVSGSADGMFRSTFDKSGLTAIPYGLFANATGGAQNMFRSTFYECKGITSLPDDLFAGITVAANNEFMYTLFGTTGLTGKYIPPSAFTGLINANPPHPTTGNMWTRTFDCSDGTGLIKECPARMHPFLTGYEGTTANSTWAGHVSCELDNPCVGLEYWDSTDEECKPCPAGYTYDDSDTKGSIDQCLIHCPAGKYIANAEDTTCTDVGVGYYSGESTVGYGLTGSRTQCPHAMPTLNDITNATDESQCVVYCLDTKYRDETTNSCVPCPTGYTYNTEDGKTSASDCEIRCSGGTWLPTANAPSCINVGDGYYAAATTVAYGSTSTREQCTNGRLTGIINASDESQCINLCNGATYMNAGTNTCEPCPIGYNAHTLSGKTSINECQIHCYAGTYIANAGDIVCTSVGDGYYAAASTVNYGQDSTSARQQCPNGQMTGTQTATNVSQCQTSCQDIQYYDSTSGQCEDCPTGYEDNVIDGKSSINQCQIYCAAGTIPATYTRLEFLQSRNQRQFIDTGYTISSDHVNGTVVVSNPVTLNGAQEDSGNFIGNIYGPGGFSSGWKKKVFGVWIQNVNGSGGKAEYTAQFTQDQVYTITYDVALTVSGNKKNGEAKLTVDNNTQKKKTVNNVAIDGEGNTMKLFTNGTAVKNETANRIDVQFNDVLFGGRIYSMQLYDNGVLKLDLIPARRESDGELGMYNKVNGEFYTNAGFETFIAGADVGDPFVACGPVGNGYYVGATYTNYDSDPVRNQCPNGSPTMENGAVTNNATNIYQCEGVQPCTNAEYPDMSTGICTSCPTGYDANTQNGKQSIYECQIYCEAGTYLAHANDATCTNVGNGYYADDSLINWGDAGTRTRCPDGGATNKENAIDVSECETVTNTCSGATYLDSNVCEPCPTGYDANITPGKDNIEQCQIICPAGSYIATANDASCTDAGAGYWAPGGVVNYGSNSTHTQCAEGLTTVGYGHGANEVGDCGRKLHIGNYVLYSKTTKPSEPAINIQPVGGNTVFYVGASDSDQTMTTLHVTQGNTQYTMYDDSILHGERDFETNTRIQQ